MKEVILLKNGEIALKGLNRHAFEDRLIKNARRKLMPVGSFHFRKAQSTIYVEPDEEGYDLDEAVDRLQKVFGIAALTRACVIDKDFELIKKTAAEYLKKYAIRVSADREVQVIGPASPSVGKVNDVYRKVIYLKSEEYQVLVRIKNYMERYIEINRGFANMRIQFDFNPMNIF